MTIGVLLAARGETEQQLLHVVAADRAFTVVRRCADAADLIAAAATGLGTVVIVAADFDGLSVDAVDRLRLEGCAVVIVDPDGSNRFAPLLYSGDPGYGAVGVVAVVPTADDVVATARSLVESLGTAQRESAVHRPAGEPTGKVIAVWGPTGAPGRTTVAITLAAALGRLVSAAPLGGSVLLVDADTYGGAVAPALGLLDEAAGLVAVVRSALQGALVAEPLPRFAPQVDTFHVLSGIARPERWPEVRASALDEVWRWARINAAWTVVDCGFNLEQDEALTFDTRAPQRNAATISALQTADVVLAVGGPDAVNLPRLIRALGDLTDLIGPSSVCAVINRVRPTASGARPEKAVRDVLTQFGDPNLPVHVIPHDAAVDKAVRTGRNLYEVAPNSPAAAAVMALAAQLAGVGEHRGRRKR